VDAKTEKPTMWQTEGGGVNGCRGATPHWRAAGVSRLTGSGETREMWFSADTSHGERVALHRLEACAT
jgi:hypothetical protein